MDRGSSRIAILVLLAVCLSFGVTFAVVVLFEQLFTNDPRAKVIVGIIVWALAANGLVWGYLKRSR